MSGSRSYYGIFDQNVNVWELLDTSGTEGIILGSSPVLGRWPRTVWTAPLLLKATMIKGYTFIPKIIQKMCITTRSAGLD